MHRFSNAHGCDVVGGIAVPASGDRGVGQQARCGDQHGGMDHPLRSRREVPEIPYSGAVVLD